MVIVAAFGDTLTTPTSTNLTFVSLGSATNGSIDDLQIWAAIARRPLTGEVISVGHSTSQMCAGWALAYQGAGITSTASLALSGTQEYDTASGGSYVVPDDNVLLLTLYRNSGTSSSAPAGERGWEAATGDDYCGLHYKYVPHAGTELLEPETNAWAWAHILTLGIKLHLPNSVWDVDDRSNDYNVRVTNLGKTVERIGGGNEGVRFNRIPQSGKHAVAFSGDLRTGSPTYTQLGFSKAGNPYTGDDPDVFYIYNTSSTFILHNNGSTVDSSTGSDGDGTDTAIMFFDLDNDLFYMSYNGSNLFGGDPAAGTGGVSITGLADYLPHVMLASNVAVTADSMPDSLPAGWGGFDAGATIWDSADGDYDISGGGIKAISTSVFQGNRTNGFKSSGKYVFEFFIDYEDSGNDVDGGANFGTSTASFFADDSGSGPPNGYSVYWQGGLGGGGYWAIRDNNNFMYFGNDYGVIPNGVDVTVRIFLDLDTEKVYVQINDTNVFGHDPAAGTGGGTIAARSYAPMAASVYNGVVHVINTRPDNLPSGWEPWDEVGAPADTVDDLTAANLTNTAPVLGAPALSIYTPKWKWDSAGKSSDITLSGNDLIATGASDTDNNVRGLVSKSSGKWYWEILFTTATTNSTGLGLINASAGLDTWMGDGTQNDGFATYRHTTIWDKGGLPVGSAPGWTSGDRIGVAWDADNELFWITKNGSTWFGDTNTGNPASGTGGLDYSSIDAGPYFPAISLGNGDSATLKPNATDWSYTAPSGFVAIEDTGVVAASLTNTAPVLGPATLLQKHALTAAALTNTAPVLGPAFLPHALSAAALTNTAPVLGAPETAAGAPFWRFIGVSNVVEVATNAHTLVTTGISETLLPGDLIIACIGSRNNTASAITLPSGEWSLVEDELSTNTTANAVGAIPSGTMAMCIRGASNPSFAFTHPGTVSVARGQLIVYRPVNGVAEKDTQVSTTTGTSTTSISTTGLTTALNEELLVRMLVNGRNGTFTAFDAATDPTTSSGSNSAQTANPIAGTWQERSDAGTTTGNNMGLAIGDAIRATAGATGNFTATSSASCAHVSITAAFRFRADSMVAGALTNTAPVLGAPVFAELTGGLVAAPLTNTAPVLGPATLLQIHVLGAAALTNTAPVLGAPALTKVLSAAALTNTAPTLGAPLLTKVLSAAALTNTAPVLGPATMRYNLSAANLTNTAPILGASVTLGQIHVLGAATLTNTAPVIGAPTIAGQGDIIASALTNTSPVLGPAIIGQRHVLTSAGLTNTAPVLGPAQGGYNLPAGAALTNTAPVLGPATIGQAHALTAAALTNTSPVLPGLSLGGSMSAAPLTNTAPVLGPATIGQVHVLTSAGLTNTAPVLPALSLTGQGALLPAALTNTSPDLGTATIGQRHVLGAATLVNTAPVLGPAQAGKVLPVASLTNTAPVLGPATIRQAHALTGSLTNTAPTLGTPPLGQRHVLTAVPLTPDSPVIPGIVLGVVGVMAAAPLTNTAPVLGPAAIGQTHVLGAAPLVNSAPVLGAPGLIQVVSLSPAALENNAPLIGAPAFGQRHILVPAALTNTAPTLPSVQMIPGGVMAAFNLANTSPLIGSPDFRERYTLVAGALANSSPVLGPARLPARLVAANFMNTSPVLPIGRLNPRYWTKPNSLSGRLNGANLLSGELKDSVNLEGGWP